MSEESHVPEGSPGPDAPKAPVPALPVRPEAPATTSDFLRFPETAETPEITSLVPGDLGPGASPPDRAGASRASGGSKTPPPGPGWTFDPQIEIERKLGAGGMGEVYLGLQKHLGRKVAVKRIRDWGEDAQNKERFIHEAKAQSCLRHPGIAQVYDLREADGALYLIMEHVEGKTLEELQRTEKKFAPDRIARIGIQLTEALESAAHEGYIHRDLKPGNVMLTAGGEVKIIDFGLALRFRNLMRTRFTQKGEILGTPAYMSPEQLNEEEKLDVRSDIWSLGVLLYALATGEPPFTGKDFVCTVKNVMMAEPVPLPAIEDGFPPGLWEVIKRALRKDREERWQDYASLRTALLGAVSAGTPVPKEASQVPPKEPAGRPSVWSLLKLLGVAASTLVFAFLVYTIHSEARNPGVIAPADKGVPPKQEARKDEAPLSSSPEAPRPTKAEPPAPASEKTPAEARALPEPPPRLRLRDRLIASPLSAGTREQLNYLTFLFMSHYRDLMAFSYEGLAGELTASGEVDLRKTELPVPVEERDIVDSYRRAAEKLVVLASGAVRARTQELLARKAPVTLKLRAGGTVTGTVTGASPTALTVLGASGLSLTIPLRDLSPEEFRPKASAESAELAFGALSVSPAGALSPLLDLEGTSDEAFLWLYPALRLALAEVEAKAEAAASEAKPLLLEGRPPENSPAALAAWTAAKAAEDAFGKAAARLPDAYGFLREFLQRAKDQTDALELLFHRQFSRAAARYPGTAPGPVAAALHLELFEKDLAAGSDELLEGSGWFNWRWELRPTHPDVKERRKYLVPKPDEELILLQDEEGPRSLVMNDISSRAPEGVLLRVRFQPLGSRPDAAEWRFHLLSEKGGASYLRVVGKSVEAYRNAALPGGADVRLAQAWIPELPVAQRFMTLALVPGPEHLHVYVDRQPLFAIPREDTAIPKQLALVVFHGTLSVRNLQAKRAPAADGGSRK